MVLARFGSRASSKGKEEVPGHLNPSKRVIHAPHIPGSFSTKANVFTRWTILLGWENLPIICCGRRLEKGLDGPGSSSSLTQSSPEAFWG